jgi:hypothetical protein
MNYIQQYVQAMHAFAAQLEQDAVGGRAGVYLGWAAHTLQDAKGISILAQTYHEPAAVVAGPVPACCDRTYGHDHLRGGVGV